MSRPSVCFLLDTTGQWGGVKIVFEQAEQLAAHGFDVVVAAKDDPPTWWDLKVPLVTVTGFGGRQVPQADLYVGTAWPTVPGAHDTGLGIGAHLIQGYEGDFDEYAHVHKEIDFVYSLKTVKMAVAPHLKRRVEERFGQPVRLVRNGIDTSVFHTRDRGPFAAGGTPRIVVPGPYEIPLKGVKTVLGALARLRAEGHDFELLRISQKPITADERALIAAAEEHVHIRPEAVAGVLRAADLMLSASSPVEGFGLPAIEAMACGCAAVLSDIPAFRGFGDAAGGWDRSYARFAAHDDPDAFAEHVAALLRDPAQAAALASSGADLAARYSWDVVGPELADAYRALIADEHHRWTVRKERMVPGESDALTEGMHVQRYEYVQRFAPGARVVDAGSGAGYGSAMMADAGAVSVRALDYCETTLGYAEQRYGRPAITWEHADLRAMEWTERSADLITCFEVFEHVVDPSSLVAGLGHALSDDGRLLVSTPNGVRSADEPNYVHHIREYDLEEFKAILGAHFAEVEVLGQRLVDRRMVMGPPDALNDIFFLATCRLPKRRVATGRFVVVGSPDWSATAWRRALTAWCDAFGPDDAVTLELVARDAAAGGQALLAALGELGLDPERIPDVALSGATDVLAAFADRMPDAAAYVPLGIESRRLGRIADSFCVPALEDVTPDALRALAGLAARQPA